MTVDRSRDVFSRVLYRLSIRQTAGEQLGVAPATANKLKQQPHQIERVDSRPQGGGHIVAIIDETKDTRAGCLESLASLTKLSLMLERSW